MRRLALRLLAATFLCIAAWVALSLTVWKEPPPPGTVVTHSFAWTGRYIGSPSFLILPNGDYLAAHDFFGPGSGEYSKATSRVFISKDKGNTWELRSEILGAFWSVLFAHRGAVYLLGVDHKAGSGMQKDLEKLLGKQGEKNENRIVIRQSTDDGRTWTEPTDREHGVIRTGNYGFAPTPVVEWKGRLWRAQGEAGMMSAPVDANLLRADSWRTAEELRVNKQGWFGGKFEGWGEGSAVVGPAEFVVNVVKVRYLEPGDDYAAIISFDSEGKKASFDPKWDFVKMPGARIKFTVRYDPVSKRYWSLSNYLPERYYGARADLRRNVIALVSSPDLRDWKVEGIVLENPDVKHHGFQYFDWDFEGDDIVGLCRTAWPDGLGGPVRQHDANYLTFHRIDDFRNWGEKRKKATTGELKFSNDLRAKESGRNRVVTH